MSGNSDSQPAAKDLNEANERIQDLQLKVEELTDFIENASLPLHWVDGNGIVIWANQVELDSLGYSREEYIGHHINEFHYDREVIDDILTRLGRNETLQNYDARLRCKDGSIKYVLINSNVLWKGDQFVHTRCFTRDITALKQEEEKRATLLTQLEDQNQKLNDSAEQLKLAYIGLEEKVKFRNHELETQVKELLEENARLKAAKA